MLHVPRLTFPLGAHIFSTMVAVYVWQALIIYLISIFCCFHLTHTYVHQAEKFP